MHYLSQLTKSSINGLTCLVRVDFNIENLQENFRLRSTLPTINFLRERGTRVILVSHRGRPGAGAEIGDPRFSLKIVLPFLNQKLKETPVFLPDFNFKKIQATLEKNSSRNIFLLENLRFLPAEEKNDPRLATLLQPLADFFVNDAFSVSHRENASVTALPHVLPSYAGLLLEKEIENLSRVLKNYRKPLIVILGGAKVSDKLGLINNFKNRASYFLVGGAVANTFLKAQGKDIGDSVYEPRMLSVVKKMLRSKKIILPFDFVAAKNRFMDIGPLTAEAFISKIKGAKTIVWNGPMGFFENPAWANGSKTILKAVTATKAFSVVGGGETTELVTQMNAGNKLGFVSTGGGAMIAFLGGEPMPGIQALEKTKHL